MEIASQEQILGTLNPQQRLAVEQLEGPMLILAGPGSGKTRVITHRIANMIAHDVPSWQIASLTFTNKAAEEMRRRLDKLAPKNQTWSGTFHRFCSRLLRQHANLVGLAENFTIYDTSDSKKVVKQAIENSKVDLRHYSADKLAHQLSNVKNNGVSHERFQPRSGHALDAIIAKVYPEYQKLLRQANGVDFDDLLLHAVELLRNSEELRASLDQKYSFMMVDEYQDTNLVQYHLIRLLNHSVQNLCVTGDPDQSIYGWRGANINNILEFERDYPAVKIIRLEQNYRSTQAILRVADQLICNNFRRKKKELRTENEEGKKVRLVAYPSPRDESTDISDSIALAIQKGERQPRDFAILYRTNWLSRSLEHSLRLSGVPYQIINGHEFYQRKEIKDVIGYLHLLNNPSDNVAFERVINSPSRKIGKVTLGRLRRHAQSKAICLLDAARECEQIDDISKAPTARILQFVAFYDGLATSPMDRVESVIRSVLDETGYRNWLTLDGSDEGFERAKNVDELVVAAEEFDCENPEFGGLEAYLEQAALVSDTDVWESESNFVTLMTLHAAKGMEFPVVHIVGLEDGILPHERSSQDDDKVEEERRLFFVGITRAEKELRISRCQNRFRRGSNWPAIASRFLMEIPRNEMEIFEPTSYSYDEESIVDSIDQLDPWMHDGIPTFDVNDDDDLGDQEKAANQVREPATIAFNRPSGANETNRTNSTSPSPTTIPFPGMVTGADLAAQEASSAIRPHPDRYRVEMLVEHIEYGSGVILNISGEGQKRTATVEFDTVGQKRFRLAFCNLTIR